ncbi:hypothetical protein Fcan01_11185 [Folsomia candida]|uniref:Uncharacterized protein n=1 Tax=Folsomia candida TaxID=158441 RepID=A0A226E7W7_FOLCA|nr:hypothetical protein Fcan01_11185 [Folsomia candida]
MHFSESPTGNREISQIYKMVMSNSTEPEFQRGDRFYCDFIALGDVRHESFQYDVRLMGEMVTIHRRLMASGLVKYWDEMFRNWRLLKNMHRALDKQKLDVLETSADQRLRKLLIQMDTLEMILYMWIVCVGLGLVGFLLCEVKLQGVFEEITNLNEITTCAYHSAYTEVTDLVIASCITRRATKPQPRKWEVAPTNRGSPTIGNFAEVYFNI